MCIWRSTNNTRKKQMHRNRDCLLSMAYLRGGTVRCPPFGPTRKIFYRRLRMKRCVFAKKMGEFAVSIEHSEAKNVSASGGLCPPWPPDHGLCPWTPLGAPPPDPRYRLTLLALAMSPLCQILNTPLPSLDPIPSVSKVNTNLLLPGTDRPSRQATVTLVGIGEITPIWHRKMSNTRHFRGMYCTCH